MVGKIMGRLPARWRASAARGVSHAAPVISRSSWAGDWNGKRLLSEDWFEMATTAGAVNDGFGFMNFALSGSRPGTWTHVGAGANRIYVDPANDLVIVCRWIRGGRSTRSWGRCWGRLGVTGDRSERPERTG